MGWRWDLSAYRYRDDDTGRFISRAHVLELINASMNESVIVSDALAGFLSSGTLASGDWLAAFRNEIKYEYIRQYLAGIGGREVMTSADWGSIGGMLKEQFGYLDGFFDEILAGNLSEAQIRARMAMYINSAREAHERAHGRSAVKWGADEVSWVINPAAENCDDCIALELMGWRPIGPGGGFPSIDGETWPGAGATVCLTNCRCSLSYRNSQTDEIFEGA